MDNPEASIDFQPRTLRDLEEQIKHFPLMREELTKRFYRLEAEPDARDESLADDPSVICGPAKWLD